mgnify:FL=1|jgi:hypothetical protein
MLNRSKMKTDYQELLQNYPFLTLINYAEVEYLGILQNVDTQIASMYMYERLRSVEEKARFLKLGEEWWWETNRKLPINIALLNRWPFQYAIQSFSVKQMEILQGPTVKLANSITKRIKRRSISLVKKNL